MPRGDRQQHFQGRTATNGERLAARRKYAAAVRVGELSKRSGVPLPTIKYYLREGLLRAGEPVCRNQARYGESHLERLRLVRALLDVGGLSIAAVKNVLGVLGNGTRESAGDRLEATWAAINPEPDVRADPVARRQAEEFVARHHAGGDGQVVAEVTTALAAALSAARLLGHDRFHELLDDYLAGLRVIACADLDYAEDASSEDAVVGLVIGNALLTTMRRLAHAQVSASSARTAEC